MVPSSALSRRALAATAVFAAAPAAARKRRGKKRHHPPPPSLAFVQAQVRVAERRRHCSMLPCG